VQGIAHVPLESSTLPDGQSPHMPPVQMLLQQSLLLVQGKPALLTQQWPFKQRPLTVGWGGQQSVSAVQVGPIDPHVGGAAAQVPPKQFSLQHWESKSQLEPVSKQRQTPNKQMLLQHSLSAVQDPPFETHPPPHTPSTHSLCTAVEASATVALVCVEVYAPLSTAGLPFAASVVIVCPGHP
jgi:hypothetical protein